MAKLVRSVHTVHTIAYTIPAIAGICCPWAHLMVPDTGYRKPKTKNHPPLEAFLVGRIPGRTRTGAMPPHSPCDSSSWRSYILEARLGRSEGDRM